MLSNVSEQEKLVLALWHVKRRAQSVCQSCLLSLGVAVADADYLGDVVKKLP